MEGESGFMTDRPECKWNIEELMVYLEARIDATAVNLEARIDATASHLGARLDAAEKLNVERAEAARAAISAAMAAADRAVNKAEVAAEKRFESVNEFRNTLSDQQRNLVPRAEFEAAERAMTFRLDAIDKVLEAQRSERVGIKGGWGYAVGVVGLVIAILSIAAALSQLAKP
jgi:hypothetical protein